MPELSFEHESGFTRGELSEPLRLGKYQAHYEELFAGIIEDGVITPEERARLNRAAEAMGLDRAELERLEGALRAAYEARHNVRVQELAGDHRPEHAEADGREPAEERQREPVEERTREPEAPPTPRRSLVVPSPTSGSQTAHGRITALEQRVAQLEARLGEMAAELTHWRARSAEAETPRAPVASSATDESPEELSRRIRNDPRDVATLHALYRAFAGADGDRDRQWLVAQVLVHLDAADAEERATYEAARTESLIRPARPVSEESWRLLFHPEAELVTGQIFSVIVSAVLLGRVAALRREGALPKLDPAQKQDAATSTLQAVRCFSWAGAVLGMAAPELYADPERPILLEMVPGVPPATRLGEKALSGRSPFELAFVAGRHLSWHRGEHFLGLLVPNVTELENLFVAGLSIANTDVPMKPEVKKRAAPLARAIEPLLEPAAIDRLRGYFFRFIEEGGRTNLQRWLTAAEHTAARAGLLLSNDLSAAHAVFTLEDAASARDKMDDLIVYATSDRYAKLRKLLGLAVATAPLK
jgi:hypothetical protein